MIASKFFMTAR